MASEFDRAFHRAVDDAGRPGGVATVADFARAVRLSPSRVRQLLRSGEIAGRKVGRKWFVPISGYGRWFIEAVKKR